MSISDSIIQSIEKSSWIRKMFEEGTKLKEKVGAENVFDFSLGNPDLKPPSKFFSELENIAKEHKDGVHGYMPNDGFPFVKEQTAKKVSKDHNFKINENSIIMTCGAAGGLNTIFKTILNPNDEVIVIKPYFVEYGFYISNHNGKIVLVNSASDFSLNIKEIENAITDKTKAILINSPNNPTGKIYSENQIIELTTLLKKKNSEIFLISDEPYREIVYDNNEVPSILKHYDNSLIVTSYSKTLSIPGERIGYIAVNPKANDFSLLMSGLKLSNRILGFVNAPALMQRIVAKLINETVEIDIYRKRRDILVNGLKKAGYEFTIPEGAFYIFVKSPIDDIEFVNELKSYNILVVPGTGFGGKGYFRISYCVSDKTILTALPFFEQALKKYK